MSFINLRLEPKEIKGLYALCEDIKSKLIEVNIFHEIGINDKGVIHSDFNGELGRGYISVGFKSLNQYIDGNFFDRVNLNLAYCDPIQAKNKNMKEHIFISIDSHREESILAMLHLAKKMIEENSIHMEFSIPNIEFQDYATKEKIQKFILAMEK